jgi:hypothetical protein
MNKYLAAFAAVSLTSVLTACSSFLDENPRGQLTEDEAYATKQDILNNGVLAIYNYIGGHSDSQGLQGTGRGVFDFNSLTTDEAIAPTRSSDWYDGGFWETLFTHNWTPGTASMKDMWDYLYKVVMMTDKFIAMIEERDDYPSDPDLVSYRAELRAVRAMYYFYIMDLFGNVPIVTTDAILTEDIVQSKRSEVFRFCVSELQEALPRLLEDKSNLLGESYGRVTQPVALFLLVKLMINAEVYADDDWTDGVGVDGRSVTFNIDGKTMNAWDACEYYCDLLDYYDYKLEDQFDANFRVTNEYSAENIFTIPMNPVLYSNWFIYLFRSRHSCHGAALGGSSENGMSATIELVKAYRYGQPDEDPRFRFTFYADTVWENYKRVLLDDGTTPLVYYPFDVAQDVTATEHEKTAGARFHKYVPDPDANADGRACNNDIVLFRYADILLMKAESQVRNGKDGSDALNAVRARVGLSAVEATLDNILAERYLELAWEGWRRNDMIRFGIFGREYSDHVPSEADLSGASVVFPIPGDLMTMHPNWKQNPGY